MAERYPSQPAPVSGAGAAVSRTGEELRLTAEGAARAAAAPVEPEGVVAPGPRVYVTRVATGAGARLGSALRYYRDLRSGRSQFRSEEMIADVKQFIRRHPSSLIGASVAGFVVGRMVRR